jgi:hypothetical protein
MGDLEHCGALVARADDFVGGVGMEWWFMAFRSVG